MNLRPRSTDDVDLNLTPLIDIVFLLLIFFMVSTTFKDKSEIKLDLPEATTSVPANDKGTIKVAIDSKGRFFVNEVPLINSQAGTLDKAIKGAAGDNEEPLIVIKADKQARHQSVVAVMDSARRLKFTKIGFETERKKTTK